MKGIAAWIWIIASVVLGILVLTFSSILILNQYDLTQKQNVISQFSDFYVKMKDVCTAGIGDVYFYKLALPEQTRAIYVSNSSDQLPPAKVSEYVTKSQTAVGNYLCLQFFDENLPRCGEMSCYSNFTYIGTPSLQPTLQNLVARLTGQTPIYYFLVQINKVDYNYLYVNSTQTIGSQNPVPVTPTLTTSQSSVTTSQSGTVV